MVKRVELDLGGKVAIVTGASRRGGIGAAVCRLFAAHGADVLFTHWQAFDATQVYGVDVDGPAELLRELRAAGVRASALEVDLTRPEAATRVLDAAAELGPPSILVNNAAHSVEQDFSTLDADTLDAHLAMNVRGMAVLSVEFARRFDLESGGRIVNLTSGQRVMPMPNTLSYATSKGAVEAFTTSLAAGVAAKGITVNAVDRIGSSPVVVAKAVRTRVAP